MLGFELEMDLFVISAVATIEQFRGKYMALFCIGKVISYVSHCCQVSLGLLCKN